jgi:hypothetical protein
MKAFIFDLPRHSCVAADAEPNRRGGRHDVRTARVSADLVDVTIDVDGGLPGYATIRRPWYPANVDVGEEHRAVRSYSYGTDPKRRPNELTIDECRTCVPVVAPSDRVEAAKLLHPPVRADTKNTCVVGSSIDNVTNCHTTSQVKLRKRDRSPDAVPGTMRQRASVDDRESTVTTVRSEASDRVIGEFVMRLPIGNDEQPIGPCSYKHH